MEKHHTLFTATQHQHLPYLGSFIGKDIGTKTDIGLRSVKAPGAIFSSFTTYGSPELKRA